MLHKFKNIMNHNNKMVGKSAYFFLCTAWLSHTCLLLHYRIILIALETCAYIDFRTVAVSIIAAAAYSVGTTRSIYYICTNNNNNNTCTLKMTRISSITLGGPVVVEERNGEKNWQVVIRVSAFLLFHIYVYGYINIYINIFVDSPDRIPFCTIYTCI